MLSTLFFLVRVVIQKESALDEINSGINLLNPILKNLKFTPVVVLIGIILALGYYRKIVLTFCAVELTAFCLTFF
jgi:hypothetical protein